MPLLFVSTHFIRCCWRWWSMKHNTPRIMMNIIILAYVNIYTILIYDCGVKLIILSSVSGLQPSPPLYAELCFFYLRYLAWINSTFFVCHALLMLNELNKIISIANRNTFGTFIIKYQNILYKLASLFCRTFFFALQLGKHTQREMYTCMCRIFVFFRCTLNC